IKKTHKSLAKKN
ncbi:Soluble lytic murein transglycosylase precursor, partial [Haemophilus influenzae]